MSRRQRNGSCLRTRCKYVVVLTILRLCLVDSLGGPLHISWPNWADPLSTWALKGVAAVGILLNQENFNSGILNGSGWATTTLNPSDSSRDSPQTRFLAQAIRDTDVLVFTEAIAQRILFKENKIATGVLVDQTGVRFVLSANNEVILSAGAFQSPQLPMVSGLGPWATLQTHEIPIVMELPGVGQNLQSLNDPTYAASVAQMYRVNNSGPLTSDSAMGRRGNPIAVVDSYARVFGVHGSRVVDSSAFPFLVLGHPQGAIYALAEKIADDILKGG